MSEWQSGSTDPRIFEVRGNLWWTKKELKTPKEAQSNPSNAVTYSLLHNFEGRVLRRDILDRTFVCGSIDPKKNPTKSTTRSARETCPFSGMESRRFSGIMPQKNSLDKTNGGEMTILHLRTLSSNPWRIKYEAVIDTLPTRDWVVKVQTPNLSILKKRCDYLNESWLAMVTWLLHQRTEWGSRFLFLDIFWRYVGVVVNQ